MTEQRIGVDYSHLNRGDTPASRLIRRSIWSEADDIGQQSFITPRYLGHLVHRLGIEPDSRVLDVGSGLGGPAVHVATTTGCHITGIELNEAGVQAALALATRAGLVGRAEFHVGDAMRMPFADGAFHLAISLNVMNVFEDKVGLFREVRRVLTSSGRWAFLSGTFEMPDDDETRRRMARGGLIPQHFDSLAGYRAKLESAGFQIEEITEYVADFAVQVRRWADAYREHADAVADEQGRENAERHVAYFDTYVQLIEDRRAANHLVIASPRR